MKVAGKLFLVAGAAGGISGGLRRCSWRETPVWLLLICQAIDFRNSKNRFLALRQTH